MHFGATFVRGKARAGLGARATLYGIQKKGVIRGKSRFKNKNKFTRHVCSGARTRSLERWRVIEQMGMHLNGTVKAAF
jgi:hypothetical protein